MKETLSKVKLQLSEWEKIIANETTNKELIAKVYKQLTQLNTREINDFIKKWIKELNRYFSKEDIQMTKKHKKMLNITHYQRDGTTMRYHFMLVRMAVIQKSISCPL